MIRRKNYDSCLQTHNINHYIDKQVQNEDQDVYPDPYRYVDDEELCVAEELGVIDPLALVVHQADAELGAAVAGGAEAARRPLAAAAAVRARHALAVLEAAQLQLDVVVHEYSPVLVTVE